MHEKKLAYNIIFNSEFTLPETINIEHMIHNTVLDTVRNIKPCCRCNEEECKFSNKHLYTCRNIEDDILNIYGVINHSYLLEDEIHDEVNEIINDAPSNPDNNKCVTSILDMTLRTKIDEILQKKNDL